MKFRFYLILLLFTLIFSHTIFATSTATVTFNGFPVQLEHNVLIENNNAWLSMNDMLHILGGTITYNDSNEKYTLSYKDRKIVFELHDPIITVNVHATITAPIIDKDNIAYVPIVFISRILEEQIHFDSKKQLLAISSPLSVQSTKKDYYAYHSFVPGHIPNVIDYLKPYIENAHNSEVLQRGLQDSKNTHSYICLVQNTEKSDILDHMNRVLANGKYKNLYVEFKELNYSGKIATITPRKVKLPFRIKRSGNDVIMDMGDGNIQKYTSVWTTYMLSHSNSEYDIDKSVDATIMRMLYEYYRNTYGLKDDLYYTPFQTIVYDKADTMVHTAYMEYFSPEPSHTPYDIHVVRQENKDQVYFTIEVTLHQ